MPNLRIVPLAPEHDRSKFCCGKTELDEYLTQRCSQDAKRDYSRPFVLVDGDAPRVIGFYTLSAGAVAFEHIPEDVAKKLPRYPMPVAHLGRMAVDKELQGRGHGELLLVDALNRALEVNEEMAIAAVEIKAKNEKAKNFYLKYGFTPLLDDLLHLYLPMQQIKKLFVE